MDSKCYWIKQIEPYVLTPLNIETYRMSTETITKMRNNCGPLLFKVITNLSCLLCIILLIHVIFYELGIIMLSVIFITLDYQQKYGTFPDFGISFKMRLCNLMYPVFSIENLEMIATFKLCLNKSYPLSLACTSAPCCNSSCTILVLL